MRRWMFGILAIAATLFGTDVAAKSPEVNKQATRGDAMGQDRLEGGFTGIDMRPIIRWVTTVEIKGLVENARIALLLLRAYSITSDVQFAAAAREASATTIDDSNRNGKES